MELQHSDVVVWDKVVANSSVAVLSCHPCLAKYPIIAQSNNLRDKGLNLTVFWEVMPITGTLKTGSQGLAAVRLPEEYCPDGCIPA